MEQIAEQVLEQLVLIRVFVFIACVALVVAVGFYIWNVFSNIKLNWQMYSASKNGIEDFVNHAEDLLRRNKIDQLIKVCDSRIETHENDPDAYVFKAKALYYTGNYHEAKRCFIKAIELESSFNYMLEPWLDSIEGKIKDNAPRLI